MTTIRFGGEMFLEKKKLHNKDVGRKKKKCWEEEKKRSQSIYIYIYTETQRERERRNGPKKKKAQ